MTEESSAGQNTESAGDQLDVLCPPTVVESTYGLARWQGLPIDVSEFHRTFENEIVSESARELGLPIRCR